jgi:hypothetical protein
MKNLVSIFLSTSLLLGSYVVAAQEFDDLYFSKKDRKKATNVVVESPVASTTPTFGTTEVKGTNGTKYMNPEFDGSPIKPTNSSNYEYFPENSSNRTSNNTFGNNSWNSNNNWNNYSGNNWNNLNSWNGYNPYGYNRVWDNPYMMNSGFNGWNSWNTGWGRPNLSFGWSSWGGSWMSLGYSWGSPYWGGSVWNTWGNRWNDPWYDPFWGGSSFGWNNWCSPWRNSYYGGWNSWGWNRPTYVIINNNSGNDVINRKYDRVARVDRNASSNSINNGYQRNDINNLSNVRKYPTRFRNTNVSNDNLGRESNNTYNRSENSTTNRTRPTFDNGSSNSRSNNNSWSNSNSNSGRSRSNSSGGTFNNSGSRSGGGNFGGGSSGGGSRSGGGGGGSRGRIR